MTPLSGIPAALTGAIFALLVSGLVGFDLASRHVPRVLASTLGVGAGLFGGAVVLFGPAWGVARWLRHARGLEVPFSRWLVNVLVDRAENRRVRRAAFASVLGGYAAHAGLLAVTWEPALNPDGVTTALGLVAGWLLLNALLCAVSYVFGR